MAVDPRISLQVQGFDAGQTFSNALQSIQRVDQIKQQRQQAPFQNRMLEAQTIGVEQANTQQQQVNKMQSVAFGAAEILPDLTSGNFAGAGQKLQARRAQLVREGLPTETTDEAIRTLAENPNALLQQVRQVVQISQHQGILKAAPSAGLASAKTEILDDGTVVQALPSGETQVRNPAGQVVTGQARVEALNKSREFRVAQKREEAQVVQTVSRTSAIKKEFSQRRRDSAREAIRINQALKVAASATQGTAGAAKLQLAKFFPSIDVTNEALLDQTLQQLTIDQLQKFKGPTTDFEFGKAQATVGAVGDSKTANIARLNSLERARWFNQRESSQFDKHIKAGGDPDAFSFNFGETINTRRGVFTLQDLQETAVANNLTIKEAIAALNKAKK